MESQRSIENSVTQENTTEILDIGAKIPHASKTSYIKPTGKVISTTNAPKPKNAGNRINPNQTSARNKNVRKDLIRPERTELNNSCSNITASTYINGNEVSTSSGIGLDFEKDFESGAHIEQKLNFDHESVCSASNDRLSTRSHESSNLLLRRESSSTYERDMDIIDLLERERSMDLQEIIERERHTEHYRRKVPNSRSNSGIERRKLPDITKITAPSSPRRMLSSEQSTNFPNFVFTHQFNEFAEARSNRNRDSNVVSSNTSNRSRNNSQTSFGKRNSDAYVWNEEENTSRNVNRTARARSIDSRKSSTKSIHENRMSSGGNNYAAGTYTDNL